MKKLLLSTLAIIALYSSVLSQKKASEGLVVQPESKWADQGFWVIEGQQKDKKHHTVYYYNNDKVLVHKETVDGRKLDASKRKTREELNTNLEHALESWAVKNAKANETILVAGTKM